MLPDLDQPLPDHYLPATIAGIEAGFACVLLGPEGEVWDFPLETLPSGVEVGTCLRVGMAGSRPVVVEVDPEAEALRPRPVGQRLERLRRRQQLVAHRIPEDVASAR